MTPWKLLFFWILLLSWTSCGPQPEQRARQGIAALNAEQPEKAVQLLEEALVDRAEDPTSAALWMALGLARARADLPGAEEAFRTAQVHQDSDPLILYNLGALLFREGRFTEAMELLDEAATLDPSQVEALELLAEAALQTGNPARARDALSQARIRLPTRRVLTSLAVLMPDADQAIALLNEALDGDAAYAPAVLNLAILLDRQGQDTARTLYNYERFLKLNADPALAEAIQARIRHLAPQLTGGPAPTPDPVLQEVQTLLTEADAALRQGDNLLAFNLCLRAAAAATRRSRPDLEERALRSAVSAAPDQARGHFALARFLVQQRRTPEAREALQRAERLAGRNPTALTQIAELYEQGLNDSTNARRIRRLLTE